MQPITLLTISTLPNKTKQTNKRREISCALIIQQKFLKFEFFLSCTVEKFKFSEFLLDDKNATYFSS